MLFCYRKLVAVCAALSTILVCHTQMNAADPIEQARALFAEAKVERDAGRWKEALDKLDQVLKLRESAGVRFHRAGCLENLGRLVEATTDYRIAKSLAERDQVQDVLAIVDARLGHVLTKTPVLTIRTTTTDVLVDKRSVSVASPLLLDPGEHTVTVPWETRRVDLQAYHSLVIVLRPPVQAPNPPIVQVAPRDATVPAVLIGVGSVFVLGAIGFALQRQHLVDQQSRECQSGCDPARDKDISTFNKLMWGSFAAGTGTLGVGIYTAF